MMSHFVYIEMFYWLGFNCLDVNNENLIHIDEYKIDLISWSYDHILVSLVWWTKIIDLERETKKNKYRFFFIGLKEETHKFYAEYRSKNNIILL